MIFAPITVGPNFVKPKNTVRDYIEGSASGMGKLADFPLLGSSVLPMGVRIDAIDSTTRLLHERVLTWEFDAKELAFAAWTEPELDSQLVTNPWSSYDLFMAYFSERHIMNRNIIQFVIANGLTYTHKLIIYYTSTERDQDPNLLGKVPIERPDWARVPPTAE
jgi:hypothetical protein